MEGNKKIQRDLDTFKSKQEQLLKDAAAGVPQSSALTEQKLKEMRREFYKELQVREDRTVANCFPPNWVSV